MQYVNFSSKEVQVSYLMVAIPRLSLPVPVFVVGRQTPHRISAPMAQNQACHLLSLLLSRVPLSVASDEHQRYPRLCDCAGSFAEKRAQASQAIYQNPGASRFHHH